MASGISFESVSEKKSKRKETQEARQLILDKAKRDHDREQWKKEQAKLRGEDTWMLPALNERLEREKKEFDKRSKKAKKEKKKKKKKKHKKEKKQKKSDSESSSEDSDDEPMWVEKSSNDTPSDIKSAGNVETSIIQGPKLQRDSWMESPLDLIPTISKKDILEQKKKEQEKEKDNEPNLLDVPGQHEKELNPYWKDGGTGMPEEKPKKSNTTTGIGDGGLSWMKKAYQRCVEQAKEERRTLEDIATEKYGSLKKLEKMMSDAEKANKKLSKQENEDRQNKSAERKQNNENSYRRDRDRSKERYRKHSRSRSPVRKFKRPSRSRSPVRKFKTPSRSRSRSPVKKFKRPSRSKSRSPVRKFKRPSRSRSRSPVRKFKRPSKSSSKSPVRKFKRPSRSRSRSPERKFKRPARSRSKSPSERKDYRRSPNERRYSHRERSRSPYYKRSRRSRSDSPESKKGHSSLSSRFKRPNDSDEEERRSLQGTKKRFARPMDSDDDTERSDRLRDKYTSRKSYVPAWKKKEYVNVEKKKEETKKEVKRKPSVSSSQSSSSSESESSESEESEEEKPKSPEVKILSEQEMNQLGAKIVRAELMGDEEVAVKLKAELEKARELRERNKTEVPTSDKQRAKEGDNVVVLTKTDKRGRVIPLPEMSTDGKGPGRKRGKKQKVETHNVKGERKQYFDDDDKFDLKTMVEREKMGTAEDDSRMFARLAQRSVDKTSDDYQIDDVFLDRAAKKQSISVSEMKERSQAIYEHKKMSGALEKCQFCFGNVPKHLIVAIGTKSYLCLPNHKSLTEGHCLIVPMHHSPSCTSVDEDVWEEIQTFRKVLVKMFQDQDEDIVFMETSMKLKYFPHMHIECVPLPKETGDLAPIYFKKAIQESEHEWSDNKKLVELKGRSVRKAVPKGFPYFSVDFGLEAGFAHVIEDERSFPAYFGREILGGMLDAEPQLWRKPTRENFDDQRKKVLQFAEKWKPYDWTQKLSKDDDSS